MRATARFAFHCRSVHNLESRAVEEGIVNLISSDAVALLARQGDFDRRLRRPYPGVNAHGARAEVLLHLRGQFRLHRLRH